MPYEMAWQRGCQKCLQSTQQLYKHRRFVDALAAAGIAIDIKYSDGLYGVCRCDLLSGEVEHRDFMFSEKQCEHAIILCQSRAAKQGGVVEIDL